MSNNARIKSWPIVITGIAGFILSTIWYSPLLFGEIWEQYRNVPNPNIPVWTMALAPLRELIASFAIAFLITKLKYTDWKQTAKLMLLLWLAFHAVAMTGAILWDNMRWQLGAVHAGDWFMKMLFMGITLTLWLNKNKYIEKVN